jgi:hypothetical protein
MHDDRVARSYIDNRAISGNRLLHSAGGFQRIRLVIEVIELSQCCFSRLCSPSADLWSDGTPQESPGAAYGVAH